MLRLRQKNPSPSANNKRYEREFRCIVQVDRSNGRVRRLDDWSSADSFWTSYVGQDDQGAVWLIEDRRRLVRIGPEYAARKVVFP